MKALVWHGNRDVRLEEQARLEPDGDDVVLEVELSGICGSDLHGYRGHPGPRVPPLVLGHETVGSFENGRYTVYPLIGCGHCRHCALGEENLCAEWRLIGMHRAGVFAEAVTVPRSSLVALPAEIPGERAVLTEPLACAVGALRPYEIGSGARVAVIGCGAIGLLSISLAARAGGEVIGIDPLQERRRIAERLGATRAVADDDDLDSGYDLVVDAAGFSATWRTALHLARAGGDVVVLGLGEAEGTFPMSTLVRRAIRLRGQFAYSRAEFAEALRLLSDGLDLGTELGWLTVAALHDGVEAFEHLVTEPATYVKVLLSTDRRAKIKRGGAGVQVAPLADTETPGEAEIVRESVRSPLERA